MVATDVEVPEVELQESDLEKIRQLIFKETGMLFEKKKDYFLTSRIKLRMAALGYTSFKDYYHELIFDVNKTELQKFIEEITVNETYFFRDFPQLRGFAEKVLPRYLEEKRQRQDLSLRTWSAGCSTGEEPYTLAIIYKEMIEDFDQWDVWIFATDIDRRVLRHAKLGIYGNRSMKDTPIPYRDKYFTKTADGWKVKDELVELITFENLNLIDRHAMRRQRRFDFIFCRNVLIYFSEDSRKKVVSYLYDALVPGGYLFLGHSESIGRITAAFELKRIDGFLCYQKPN